MEGGPGERTQERELAGRTLGKDSEEGLGGRSRRKDSEGGVGGSGVRSGLSPCSPAAGVLAAPTCPLPSRPGSGRRCPRGAPRRAGLWGPRRGGGGRSPREDPRPGLTRPGREGPRREGVAQGRAGGGPGPRLTVNEGERPQEHDPGQPEGACAEAGRAARGVAPRPRRRPRSRARAPDLPPPQRLLGRRHRWPPRRMRGERRAATTRPLRPAPPTPGGHAHSGRSRPQDTPSLVRPAHAWRTRPPRRPHPRPGSALKAARGAAAVRARGWGPGRTACMPPPGPGWTHCVHYAFIHSSSNVVEAAPFPPTSCPPLPSRLPSWTLTLKRGRKALQK